MPFFSYKGRNASDELVKGVLETEDSSDAAELLRRTGITPIHIQRAKGPAKKERIFAELFEEKAEDIEVMMFSRQMHTLLKAGIPVMSALECLQASTAHKKMAAVINDLRQSLNEGHELSVSMSNHPKVFSAVFVSMVRVGESTGMLETIFIRMYEHLEFEKFMRDQIKAALRYPSFVLMAIAIAIVVINIFVIPAFAKVFEGFGAELPLMTRVLIGFSDFMVNYWLYLLLSLVGIIYAFKAWLASNSGRHLWDKTKLNIPVAGKVIQTGTLGRFARSFSLAYRSGVPIVQTMTLVAETIDNHYIADKVKQMRSRIEGGDSVHLAAVNAGIFTPMVLQMIAVGEESGSLDVLMQEVADMFQSDVEYELKALGTKIEPIMIGLLGIMVLILALGIFLPIWDLGSAAI